jgi:hypothetical protein
LLRAASDSSPLQISKTVTDVVARRPARSKVATLW